MRKFMVCFALMAIIFAGSANGAETANYVDAKKVSGDFYQMLVDYYTDQRAVRYLVHDVRGLRNKLDALEEILITEDFDKFVEPRRNGDAIELVAIRTGPNSIFATNIYLYEQNVAPLRFTEMIGSFDDRGVPSITSNDFEEMSTGVSYLVDIHYMRRNGQVRVNPMYEIIQIDGGKIRSFVDYNADGFSADRDPSDFRREKRDKFKFERYDYSLYDDSTLYLADNSFGRSISAQAVNQTFIPIVMMLDVKLRSQKDNLHQFVVRLEEMKRVLTADLIAKRRLVRERKEFFNNQLTLGRTYSPFMMMLRDNSVIEGYKDFLKYVKSLDSLDDLRRIYSQNSIVYPSRQSRDFTEARNNHYASPWTTFKRGFGVCDELAIYAAAFLVSLMEKGVVDEVVLASYGYVKSDGKRSYHAIVLFHTKAGWQYISSKYFSRVYKTRLAALRDSSLGVGYDADHLLDVSYRRVTSLGSWVHNDLASKRFGL